MSVHELFTQEIADEAFSAAMNRRICLDMPHPAMIVWNRGECICYSTKFSGVFWHVPNLDGYRVNSSVLTTLTAA